MKKHFIYSLVCACLLMAGCSKNETFPEKPRNVQWSSNNPYDVVGEAHNAALAAIYDSLDAYISAGHSLSDSAQLFSIIHQTAGNFFVQNPYTTVDTSIANGEFINALNKVFDYKNGGFTDSIIEWESSQYSLSTGAQDLLHDLSVSFDNIEDIESLLLSINSIENSVEDLSSDEQRVVLIACAVGKYSAQYWDQNFQDWASLLGPYNKTMWYNVQSTAKADVAGGIGGAIGGAIVGGLSTGGIGAGPGAIAGGVGGAVATSVTDAITQLLNHWW